VRIAAAAVLLTLVITGFTLYRKHDHSSAGSADATLVRDCLQSAGRRATIETSSTGTRQVAIAEGPVKVSSNTTLENATTYISFMSSASEAAWWVDQLRASAGISEGSLSQSGSAFVQWGPGATAAERTAVASCLS
jgi:hypothetical protein